jgi:hypothetical protein
MISTEEGMRIDEREEHSENASCKIPESFEGDSKDTIERLLQPDKQ